MGGRNPAGAAGTARFPRTPARRLRNTSDKMDGFRTGKIPGDLERRRPHSRCGFDSQEQDPPDQVGRISADE